VSTKALTVPLKRSQFGVPGCPFKEGALHEVVGYERRTPSVVLVLRQVRTLQIAGVWHITELST